ncbi:amidohydrolase [Chitinophaga skermanii]|nr:amidohydrolase [Chitinophaga skermanii]
MKQLLFAFCLLAGISSVHAQGTLKASIIIINGNIHTLDPNAPKADAIAINDNKIIATGSNKQILSLKNKTTRIIDAQGKTVIPGLFDSHLHVIRGGRFYNSELRWDGVRSLKRALEMLKEQAQRTPPGQWVRVVGGWNEFQFEEKRLPTLAEINEATGNTPAFILYLYSKAWLNKAGLAALKMDENSPNPMGGLIEKDNQGKPTGLLVAEPNAFILYSTLAKLPELSTEERVNSTLQFMRELNRLGVTAVMDAGGGFQNFPDDYTITDQLNKEGKITLRLPYYLFAQKKGTELQDYNKWIGMVDIDHQGHNDINHIEYKVAGGGENLVADAADFENFLFPRPELPTSMESSLTPVLTQLVKNRWPFRIHATYNESIGRDLDVIEQVNKTISVQNAPWFFDHAETISDENIARIKALGGGVAIQHRMAYQGELFVHRYGIQQALHAPPVAKLLKAGIPVGLGTDGTRVASYNPWVALYWLVTGKTLGGNTILSPDNQLDRTTALQLLTTGSYSLIKQQEDKGMLKKGYLADVVILDRDYFNIPGDEILQIQAVLTIVDGKIVYGAAPYAQIAPAPLPVIPAWSPVKYFGGYQYK